MDSVECILCENSFGSYAVPRSSAHRPAAQVVLGGGVWELETIRFMRDHAAGRDIAHAGTYFGDFLPALAAVATTVYAFEPNTENFRCAQWTLRLNGLTNVQLHHGALGDVDGTGHLEIARDGYVLGGMSHITAATDAVYEDVPLMRLDDVLPPDSDIGVLQLDVEGFEQAALAGALSTIQRCRPILILETLPEAFVTSHLTGLGYRLAAQICGNTVLRV
ncbi:FkbM family methyltransferase [Mycobacterium paraterrae]|uniref:FkbM family methyltransferase n=1 Tax=Mycobacterium paraterrae TaxID=577492 RepID=A0ABY3VMG9_9MYCO|nr:FkbM family methyltransferase [Mycobacterium paraterrae]UMB70631.1 FkbM family methyltransferase [Mycobacterium paraterrae]